MYNNFIVLTSSIERKVAIFNMDTYKIEYYFDNVGIYPIVSFLKANKLLVVDSVGKQLILYNLSTSKIETKKLSSKPLSYKRIDNIIYVLDMEGNLYGFNFNLETVYYYKFLSTPDYFDFYNSKPIAFYLWKNEFDIEFENEFFNFNLKTPTFIVSKYIFDTRGGKILDFEKKKIIETQPYLSFGLLWNDELYFASMYTKEIYKIKNDKIYNVMKLSYQPTNGIFFNDKLYVLSASDNKLIAIDKEVKIFDTGKFPIDIYAYKGKLYVICAENGEINIYKGE